MLDGLKDKNITLIFLLVIILIILFLIKTFLSKKLNKKDLIIVKDTYIGNKEIQDNCTEIALSPEGTLGIICDGFGKDEIGRISSIIAVKTISRMFLEEGSKEKISYFFKKAFNKANKEIIKRVENDHGGASVLSVIVTKNLLQYALVGDAMVGIFRNKELVKLSEGHAIDEVAKRAYYDGKIDKSQALCALKEKKIIYYLGQNSLNNIEICENPIKLKKNDIIVLMSKGIYENIRWIELEKILAQKNTDLQELCMEIAETAQITFSNNFNGSIILMKYCKKERRY